MIRRQFFLPLEKNMFFGGGVICLTLVLWILVGPMQKAPMGLMLLVLR